MNQQDKYLLDLVHRIAIEFRDFSWTVDTECKRAGIDPDSMTFREEIASDVESLYRGQSSSVMVVLPATRRSDGASVVGWVVVISATKAARGHSRELRAFSTIDVASTHIENGWRKDDLRTASAVATMHTKRWVISDRSHVAPQVEELIRSLSKEYKVVGFSTTDGRGRLLSHACRLMHDIAHASQKAYRRLASRRATITRSATARLRDAGYTNVESAMAELMGRIFPQFAGDIYGIVGRRTNAASSICSLMRAASGKGSLELGQFADIIECVSIDMPSTGIMELTSSVDGDDIMVTLARIALSIIDSNTSSYVLNNSHMPLGEVLRYVFGRSTGFSEDYISRMIAWSDASHLTPSDVLGTRQDVS